MKVEYIVRRLNQPRDIFPWMATTEYDGRAVRGYGYTKRGAVRDLKRVMRRTKRATEVDQGWFEC